MLPSTASICYEDSANLVRYKGYSIPLESCAEWLQSDVRDRVYDAEGEEEFFDSILKLEGFDNTNLLAAMSEPDIPADEYDIGETMAELALMHDYGALLPFPRRRDLRGRRANMQGCDLIGFLARDDGKHQFIFAEVKTSTQKASPPTVMNGEGGLQYQLADLILDGLVLRRILQYVLQRVKNTPDQNKYNEALQQLADGFRDNKKIVGVLVRDTEPNSNDLSGHAEKLSKDFPEHQSLSYLAIYVGAKQCDWITHCPPRS